MIQRIAIAPATPLWSSLGSAMRHTLRSLAAPATDGAAFAALEGEQARIRQSARLWLIG